MKMDKNKVILIQGCFFQENKAFHIGYKPGIGEAVMVSDIVSNFMFVGILLPLSHTSNAFEGTMKDHYGKSDLFDISLSDKELKLSKLYIGRDDQINYSFTKQGNFWLGEYAGRDVGKGSAWCVLTTVSKNLFDSEQINNLLSKKEGQ